jgi:hypothetical protein
VPLLPATLLCTFAVAFLDRRADHTAGTARLFTREGRIAASQPDATADGVGPPAMQLVVVAQRRDCDGNLSFAAFFHRARLRDRVVVRQLLIEGTSADTLGLRARLPAILQRVPLALLNARERDALQSLGHHATPVFLLLDAEHRVLAAVPVDPDPVHRTAFLRALTHLATRDPRS